MRNIWLVVPFLLAGCPSNPPVDAAAASKANKERRVAKAEEVLNKTPVPRVYTIDGNKLHVLQIPVADKSGFVEVQRCFVYRDAEFKTVTMSCPSEVLTAN